MAEHHLPPEPGHHHKGGKVVHADDLKPARRRGYGYYGHDRGSSGLLRTLCFLVLVILLLAGITALVLYLVYRPTSPAFAVNSIAVYSISNVAAASSATPGAPSAVAASFQCSLVIRNPSGRASARYDKLTAYVVYRGEAITAPAQLPPLAQDPDSAVVVAPVIGGGAGAPPVPVSHDTAAALANDVSYGVVSLRVVLLGRVRFVSGPFRRGWRSMYARCDLLVGVRKGPGVGAAGVPEAPLLGNPSCDVEI
jgi:hypothetical protein